MKKKVSKSKTSKKNKSKAKGTPFVPDYRYLLYEKPAVSDKFVNNYRTNDIENARTMKKKVLENPDISEALIVDVSKAREVK